MMEPDLSASDICRVCRSEGVPDRPLFHPCICTGSIKWIHQECLTQWMRYSRKEYCELCGHRFSFTPIYSPDMPRRLPLKVLVGGLLSSVATAVKHWIHYTLVAIAWLFLMPLAACRIYRCLFSGSIYSVLKLPFNIFALENIPADVCHGVFVFFCTLLGFIGLIWLREQIIVGGGPDWLERENTPGQAEGAPPPENNNVPGDENDNLGGVVDAEPPAEANQANQEVENPGDGDAAGPDEGNWIPMEWDRAEELTWERLLGLDGSLVFMEHVMWVVSLNTFFILVFAFTPYHVGRLAVTGLGVRQEVSSTHFEGLITTLCGYSIIGVCLLVLHSAASLLRFRKYTRLLGLCYVVVKVSLLSVVEVGVLPLVCGWWLDICSLAMFDATLKDRESNFRLAPGTSVFIHWLVGMVYVYYFASFVLLLREILRPGVLWFLRNLNDPDFSPIQEMIHLPILRHIRRLLNSAIMFGTAVLVMLWLPVRLIKLCWPSFLPYTVALNSEAQVNELSLELILLQVVLPALLEQSHMRTWLQNLIRTWCRAVAWALDLHSYLLGDELTEEPMEGGNAAPAGGGGVEGGAAAPPRPAAAAAVPAAPAGNLRAAHLAFMHRERPTGFQPYKRPRWFPLRLGGLVMLTVLTLLVSSVVALTLPVWLGRQVMTLWLMSVPGGEADGSPAPAEEPGRVHELYTAACGAYICWLSVRALTVLLSWLPQGRATIVFRLRHWCLIGAKTLIASAVLLGVLPLLFGLLLEHVMVIPLRVPLWKTPVPFIWQNWALGVLYTKIACALTMMGPDWALRAAIEKAYRDGIRDMDLGFILRRLAAPVIMCFGLALAVPYVLVHSVVPLVVALPEIRIFIARTIYPVTLFVGIIGAVVHNQFRRFCKLYEHIKNDKYLVGQRLVNYDHRRQRAQVAAAAQQAPPAVL